MILWVGLTKIMVVPRAQGRPHLVDVRPIAAVSACQTRKVQKHVVIHRGTAETCGDCSCALLTLVQQ